MADEPTPQHRFNQCHCVEFWPFSVSGPYSCHCTDAHRRFRCLSGGSSGASGDHVFNSQSDLVKVTPVFTPMLFSLNHRNFRCFRVSGPECPVSLIPPAGPACQPLFLLFSTRTAALGLSLSTTRTPPPPRQCSPLLTAAAAGPQHRRLRTAPPPHARRCRASPAPAPGQRLTAPCLRRPQACAAACLHCRQRVLLDLARVAPPAPLHARGFEPCSELSPPLFWVHSRCSRNCLLGCFFDFFPDLQGYDLHTRWHVKFFWFIIFCTHAHITLNPKDHSHLISSLQ